RVRVLSLLRALKSKRNLTIIMISHDLATAKLTSDWVVVLYRGKLVEKGRTQEVLNNPLHPYVALMLESMPTLDTETTPVDEIQSSDKHDEAWSGKGCIFYPRCKYATDVCKESDPALEEISSSHSAACHHPLNA
ncbi:MAG: ABC transporter ATP-binding protein, partial [Thaumarchaeota archaeon]|nr:ABC transporter ATP-binding protein [Nitrososphaerota archaeon]